MNHKISTKRPEPDYPCLVRPPVYPFAAPEILNKIRASLEQQTKRKMTFEQIGRITGQGTSTAHYWWSESVRGDLVGLLCILEQLTPIRRQQILTAYCRVLPTLDHPRLAHDLHNIALLVDVLRLKRGITLITGGTESARSFVFATLAHAFPAIDPRHRVIAGIDLRRPSELVPVATLIYAGQGNDPAQLRAGVRQIWPEITQSTAQVLCFNGVWTLVPEVRADLLRWSRRRHVILAENGDTQPHTLRGRNRNVVRVLAVSSAREPGAIHLDSRQQ